MATVRHVGGDMGERKAAEETLVNAARGLALLAMEAYSVGLAAGLAVLRPLRMAEFVGGNVLDAETRALLLRVALSCVVVAVLCGSLLWLRRGAARLWDVARRLAPALLAAALPPLLNWKIWEGRDLHFLVLAGAFVLGLRGLTLVALSAPPCGMPTLAGLPPAGRGGRVWRVTTAALRRPFVLVCMGAGAYALYFAYYTIVHHRIGLSTSFDLAIEDNILWNIVHGGPFFKSSPYSGAGASHFGHHATFLAYALAPIYALHQSPETLLAMQALLVGAAALPLFLWSRAYLGDGPATLVAFCYLLFPAVHGPNLYDFHYPVLAPFFLWLTLWAVESRRNRIAAAGLVLSLATREDVAASVVVLGLYLVLSGRRVKAGAVISTVAIAYFAIMKFVAMPMAQATPAFLYAWSGLLPAGELSFSGVVKTMIGNPVHTLGTLLTLEKLVYALQILTPLAFLPLGTPWVLLLAVPGLVFTLLSTGYPPFTQISFQYAAHWTGFMFPALVLALRPADRVPGSKGLSPRAFRAALAALTAATLVCSYQYGAVLQRNTARGGFAKFHFGVTEIDRSRQRELAALVAVVPPRAKISASETVVPHVSGRPDAYTLRFGVYDAEYLLFSLVPAAAGEVEAARDALASDRFGVVSVGSYYVLARRGQDPARNAPVLEHLSHFVPVAPR